MTPKVLAIRRAPATSARSLGANRKLRHGQIFRPAGLALLCFALLTGCSTHSLSLFHPKGPIAATELHMMIIDAVIMLGIIIPTALLVTWFLWRYRASTSRGSYDPNWSHSTTIEVVVWSVPLMVVAVLGYYSYKGVYEVNPYHPTIIARKADGAPIEVDVIATDWQWLFIYPKQHIATIDELVIPAHTRVQVPSDLGGSDKQFLHSGTGWADLCHARHAHRTGHDGERPGNIPRLFRRSQRSGLLVDAVSDQGGYREEIRPLGGSPAELTASPDFPCVRSAGQANHQRAPNTAVLLSRTVRSV